jgi:hypothetical protein
MHCLLLFLQVQLASWMSLMRTQMLTRLERARMARFTSEQLVCLGTCAQLVQPTTFRCMQSMLCCSGVVGLLLTYQQCSRRHNGPFCSSRGTQSCRYDAGCLAGRLVTQYTWQLGRPSDGLYAMHTSCRDARGRTYGSRSLLVSSMLGQQLCALQACTGSCSLQ